MSEAAAMEKESIRGEESTKEGQSLLGSPTFKQLENGRFKCIETGHELPAHDKEAYSRSKHCRLDLIDAALARNKPPLNMSRQDPCPDDCAETIRLQKHDSTYFYLFPLPLALPGLCRWRLPVRRPVR